MKVFFLVVMVCLTDNPGLLCDNVVIKDHPGKLAETKEECLERSRDHVKDYFASNTDLTYRGHHCVQDPGGEEL